MSTTPKTQIHAGITFTWQTLKGVEPGALIGNTGLANGNVTGFRVIASMERESSGRRNTYTDGASGWSGMATKFWVAPAQAVEVEAPKATKTYAPAVKADGAKTHKAAARMFARVGSVTKVAAHFGCSTTACARWIRQGNALLGL